MRVSAAIVSILATLSGLSPTEKEEPEVVAFLHSTTDTWVAADFEREFQSTPELEGLTDTPFMLTIVTQILQRLKLERRAPNDIRKRLLAFLDEETTEVTCALVRNKYPQLKTPNAMGDAAAQESLKDLLHNLALEVSTTTKSSGTAVGIIEPALRAALKRPPTSRTTIYSVFMKMWIEREAMKESRSGFSPQGSFA